MSRFSEEGDRLAQAGRLAEAKIKYHAALAADPSDTTAYNGLGIVAAMEGNSRQAESYFRDAIRIRPDDARAYGNLGRLYAERDDSNLAISWYRQARDRDPQNPQVQNNLGMELEKVGNDSEAQQAFEQAIQLEPMYAEAHNNLGVFLARKGRFDEAKQHFQTALSINPSYQMAHNNLKLLQAQKQDMIRVRRGQAQHLEDKDEIAAIKEYQQILQMAPDDPTTHNNLGMLLARKGDFSKALEHLQGAVELDPEYDAFVIDLDLITYERVLCEELNVPLGSYTNEPNLAWVHLTRAIAKFPSYAEFLDAIGRRNSAICRKQGWLLESQRKMRDAEAEYKHGVQLAEMSGDTHAMAAAWCDLGAYYRRKKDHGRAMSSLNRALSHIPNYERAKLHLNKLGSRGLFARIFGR